ncbi:membrane protein, partial [gut metagenome]
GNPWGLLPIGVFLVVYLGLGLLFEYGLKIPMGFYNIPIVIAFLLAILVACLQNKPSLLTKNWSSWGRA